MQITAAECKLNMGKYLSIASRHDIFITKNGQRIAMLTNPSPDRVAMLDSPVGIARGADISPDDIKRSAWKTHENHDRHQCVDGCFTETRPAGVFELVNKRTPERL